MATTNSTKARQPAKPHPINASAHAILSANPNTEHGFLRLVHFNSEIMTTPETCDAQFLRTPIDLVFAPYGKVTLTALRAPEVSYLEIYQTLEQ